MPLGWPMPEQGILAQPKARQHPAGIISASRLIRRKSVTSSSFPPEDRNSLVSQHLQVVHSIARTVAGERGAWQYFDDLVQAGCLKLAEILRDCPDGRLAFCRKRLEWAMLELLRQEYRQRHVELIPEIVCAHDTPPDQQIQEHQVHEKFKRAVKRLPKRERKVVEIYLDSPNQLQVSKELQCSRPMVSKVLSKAVRRMRPMVIGALAA